MSQRAQEVRLAGRAISQGLAMGKAFVYREAMESLAGASEIQEHQIEEELQRIDRALETVVRDLSLSAARMEGDTNAKLAAIFEAHQAILQDPQLRQEIRILVEEEMVGAAHAMARVFRRWERRFASMTEQSHRKVRMTWRT